jgi:hypothetical protein
MSFWSTCGRGAAHQRRCFAASSRAVPFFLRAVPVYVWTRLVAGFWGPVERRPASALEEIPLQSRRLQAVGARTCRVNKQPEDCRASDLSWHPEYLGRPSVSVMDHGSQDACTPRRPHVRHFCAGRRGFGGAGTGALACGPQSHKSDASGDHGARGCTPRALWYRGICAIPQVARPLNLTAKRS